jgi:hypothetical protein
MMTGQNRMSPMTALFLGMFGVGAVGIASGATIVLYGMRIIDQKASAVVGFAENTITGLPDLLRSLPPAVAELLNDRRAPEYAGNLDMKLDFVPNERNGGLRPVMSITNTGDEVVSMLAVRVAAMDARGLPVEEWTQVVATPIAVDDDWRGPLFPGKTRHVVLSGWRSVPAERAEKLNGDVEVSELRIWQPKQES